MKSSAAPAKQAAYRPYGGADLLWRCRKGEVLYDGPAGTGKTRAVLEKVVLAALKYPGARILLSRKTRASMTQTVLVTLEDKVLPPWGFLGHANRSHRESYKFPNGSEIVIGGWDRAERILSCEYDIIVYHQAEEGQVGEWETALTRLRNGVMPYQQAIAECNPGPPQHWLMHRAESRQMHRIISRHSDNPAVTDEYLSRLRTSLTGHRRERLYAGKWVAAEGLVYEQFDEAVHRKRIRRPWQRFVIAIDDGYTNPLSAHLYAADNDGRVHSLREFYKTHQLPDAILSWAKRMRRAAQIGYGEDVEAVVIDPSAAKLIAAFEDADFPVYPADNAVSDGIKTVAEYLAINGDDLPRVTFDPRCVNQAKEFGAYQWAKDATGQVKDVPRKRDDHAMDELRYALRYFESTSGDMGVTLI